MPKPISSSPSLSRRPWLPWVVLLLFFAAAASVPLAMRFRRERQRQQAPGNLTMLAERIKTAHPDWQVVPLHSQSDGLEFGFWVSKREVAREQLGQLLRSERHGPKWRGVVHCQRESEPTFFSGDYSVHVNDFTLFGDPDMIREIIHRSGL
jgi:hypothetical protein